MTSNKKIIIGVLIVIAILLIVVFINKSDEKNDMVEKNETIESETNTVEEENVKTLTDGTKLNTSEALKKEKKLDGLKIYNIQLTNSNGQTVLLATVENTKNQSTELRKIKIKLLDENGNIIGEVLGKIPALEAGAKTQLNVGTAVNYSNAYDFIIE